MSDNEKNISHKTNVSDEYNKTIEIREKRIGIVFKVIYVFALFFGAAFLDLSKKDFLTEFNIYAAESCVLAFLLVMIVFFIMYIIDEMKCMRLSASSVSDEQIKHTERMYSSIFFIFPIALITSFFSLTIITVIDKTVLLVLFSSFYIKIIIAIAVFFFLTLVLIRDDKKRWKIREVFLGVVLTLMLVYLFMNIGAITSNVQVI